MPANYTHYRFGKCVLQVFPESLSDIVSHDLQAFYTGLHGPDLFFYHRPFSGHSLRTYGTRLHDEPAAAFFEKGAEVVRCADQDTTLCYLLGFLCHFVLDSACHEYIDEYDEEGKKYILEHLDEISDAISNNENISYYSLEEDEKLGKYFDMVFYWGKLLNSTEMIVLKNADLFKIDLNLEDVREIASELVDDDEFNDALINLLKKYDKGKEIE